MSKQYNITIPKEIINEFIRMENGFYKSLKDDREVFLKIIEMLLYFEKEDSSENVFFQNDIKNYIWEKYPNLYSDPKHINKKNVFHSIYGITQILTGKHGLLIKELEKLPLGYYPVYCKEIRKFFEKKLEKLFCTEAVEEKDYKEDFCLIIGETLEENNNAEF